MTRIGRIVVIALVAFGMSAAARAQTAQADAPQSPGHVFWVLPAFNVDNQQKADPLTPRQKFGIWVQGATDPIGLAFKGVQATLEHSSSGFCGYGGGLSGFSKCYAAGVADGDISAFVGDYAFASLLHQDPRYFREGEGGSRNRLTYSLSRVFVRQQDSGDPAVSTSLIGTVVAATASNLYYPRGQRGVGLTMSRIGWDLGGTALFNLAAEYWPDVQRHLHHKPRAAVQNNGASDPTP